MMAFITHHDGIYHTLLVALCLIFLFLGLCLYLFIWWRHNVQWASQMVLVVKNQHAVSEDIRDAGLIPGSGRSSGGGHGTPLQCSCLENPTDRGAWRAAVYGVTESQTRLKWLSTHARTQRAVCGILIPRAGIEPTSPAVKSAESRPLDPQKSQSVSLFQCVLRRVHGR